MTLRPKVVWHPHPAPRPPPVARRPLQLRFLRFFCAIFSEGRPHRGRARALARPCRWRFGRPPAPSQYPDARPGGRPGDRGSAPFVVHRWNMSNQNTWDSDLFYPARAPLRARPAPLSACAASGLVAHPPRVSLRKRGRWDARAVAWAPCLWCTW